MKSRKTWKEKLEDSKDLPKVEIIPHRLQVKWGTGTLKVILPKQKGSSIR